jgi:hypothetical protein
MQVALACVCVVAMVQPICTNSRYYTIIVMCCCVVAMVQPICTNSRYYTIIVMCCCVANLYATEFYLSGADGTHYVELRMLRNNVINY